MALRQKLVLFGSYGNVVLFLFLTGLSGATTLPHRKDVDTSSAGLLTQESVLAAWVSGAVLLSLVVLTIVCLCCKSRRFKDLSEDVAEVSGSSMSPMSDMFAPMSSFTNSPVEIEPLPDITVLSHSGAQPPHPPDSVLDPFESHPTIARGVRKTNFPRTQLNYVTEIGNGWFGKVLAAEASGLVTGEQKAHVIVRQLKPSAGPEEQAVFLQELQPNRELQHPNLLVVLAQCLETMPFLLIMEYCAMGDLKGYLVRQRREAPSLAQKGTLLRMACDVSAGLHFMHQNGFTHGDLALRNCMVGSDLTVKIGDYGLSHERYKGDYALVNQTELVPVRWMAPETVRLSGGHVRLLDTTTQANVWSFGVCLWELLELGRQPYSGLSDQDVLVEVISEQTVRLPQPVMDILHADRWYELMQFCWLSAEERPSMGELYSLLSYLRHQKEELDAADFERKWTTMKPRDTVASLNDSKLALNGSAVSSSPDLVMSHLQGSSHSLNVSVTSQDSRLSGSVASGVVPVDVIVHWPRRSSATSSIVSTGTLTGSETERAGGQDGGKASRTGSASSDNASTSVHVTEPDTALPSETNSKPHLPDTGTSEVSNSNVSANNSNSAASSQLLPSLLRPHEQEQQQEQQRMSQQQHIQQEVRQASQQHVQGQQEGTVSKGQQFITREELVSKSQQSTSTADANSVVQEASSYTVSTHSTFSLRNEVHESFATKEHTVHTEKVTELSDAEPTLFVSSSDVSRPAQVQHNVADSIQHSTSKTAQAYEDSIETKTLQDSDSIRAGVVRSAIQGTLTGKGSFQRTSTPTLEVEAAVQTPAESPVKSDTGSDAITEESSESVTGSYATPDTSISQPPQQEAIFEEDRSEESQLFLSAADFSQTLLQEKTDSVSEEERSAVAASPAEDCEGVDNHAGSDLEKVCTNGNCEHNSNDTTVKHGEQWVQMDKIEYGSAFDSLNGKEDVRTFGSAKDKDVGYYWSAFGPQAIDQEAIFVGKVEHGHQGMSVEKLQSTESPMPLEEQDYNISLSCGKTDSNVGNHDGSADEEAYRHDNNMSAFTESTVGHALNVTGTSLLEEKRSEENFNKPGDLWNTHGTEDDSNSNLSVEVQPKGYDDHVGEIAPEESSKDDVLDFSATTLGQDIFGSSFVPVNAKLPRDEDSVCSSVQGDSGADITGDWASSDEEQVSAGPNVDTEEKESGNILDSTPVSGSNHTDVTGKGTSFHDSAAQFSPKGSPKFSPKDELELYRERKASLSESHSSEEDTSSPGASEVKTVITNDVSDETESPDSAMLVSPYAEDEARDIDTDSLEDQVTGGVISLVEDVPAIVVTMDPATTGPVMLLDELDGPRESTDHPDSMAPDQTAPLAHSDVLHLTDATELDESTTDDLPESDARDSALASSIQSTPLTPSPTTALPPQPQKSALKQPGLMRDKSRRVCFLTEGSSVHVEVFNYTKEPDEDLEHIVLIRDNDGSSTSETDSEMDEDSSLQGEYDWGSDDEEDDEEYDLEWDDGMTRVVHDMNSMTSASPGLLFTQAAISSNYVGSSAAYIPRTTVFNAAVDGEVASHVTDRLQTDRQPSPLSSPSWSPSRFSVQPADFQFTVQSTKAVEDLRDDSDSLEVVVSEEDRPVTSP